MIINLTKKYEVDIKILENLQTGKVDTMIFIIDNDTPYEELEKYKIAKNYYGHALRAPKTYIALQYCNQESYSDSVYKYILNLDIMLEDYNIEYAKSSYRVKYGIELDEPLKVLGLQLATNSFSHSMSGMIDFEIDMWSKIDSKINNLSDIEKEDIFNCVKIK